jgi:hypothetical protein
LAFAPFSPAIESFVATVARIFIFHIKGMIADSTMVQASEFPIVVIKVPKTFYHSQTKTLMLVVS